MKISTKSKSSKSYTKCWICDDTSVDGDVKVKVNVILLENMEVLPIGIVILRSDKILKFLLCFTI